MENGHPSIGLEDGSIDVERLLVEPQDEHLSMDSVISFNGKILKNSMSMEDVSHSSGRSDTGFAQEGKDILNGEVLNTVRGEVKVGCFRLENDLCSMGEEYLLGVQFAESITNLDYSSSEGMHTSASDSQVQVFTAGSDTECRSDLFITDNLMECQINSFNVGSSKLSDTSHLCECEALSGDNPTISPRSCSLQNSVKSQNSSSSSCQDVLSDENGGKFSQAAEILCSSKTERNNDIDLTVKDGATRVIKVEDSLRTSVQVSSTDVLPTQKRSRKPTQRYICELADPILTFPKRRREVSSSTIKTKSLGVRDHKKCQIMGPKAIRESPEEFSVVAIQVPFGSLVNKEGSDSHAYDMVPHADCRNSMTKSKGKFVTLQNQNKVENCVTAVDLKKRGDYGTGQKKTDVCFTEAQIKKKDVNATATNLKKRNDDCSIAVVRKKRDNCFAAEDCSPAAHQKIRDDGLTCEEISGRRKHHRLWTISEVRKLIDGVSQYGVGRWSRIKKLFFSASAHRTSVDLKDKWRNLLKASGMHEQGSQQGEKKRNLAWRPLPKSILSRVCELAAMYPYPKEQRAKISRDSPDTSADITLSDYRRILRSIH